MCHLKHCMGLRESFLQYRPSFAFMGVNPLCIKGQGMTINMAKEKMMML